METVGYSKTPLSKKLGIKEKMKLLTVNEPRPYKEFFFEFPDAVIINPKLENQSLDLIHIFIKTRTELAAIVNRIKPLLKKEGVLWVSWPKGSSTIKTELKREPIRDYILKTGLVDTKVCAVDSDWSGLKFVYRKENR
ncbi:DUF3052 family protein [Costertonia aggregata]|uniref:DUF3052 family protein n=1 Tax=Costertonia aggregata TaxID=343403 RepID=A0A7H9AMM1_9FLAO|nr:DUF3052 family protein [Costertonia aggregata]QLG44706.1 DUF3052 family protein [Costertonia aggregata]